MSDRPRGDYSVGSSSADVPSSFARSSRSGLENFSRSLTPGERRILSSYLGLPTIRALVPASLLEEAAEILRGDSPDFVPPPNAPILAPFDMPPLGASLTMNHPAVEKIVRYLPTGSEEPLRRLLDVPALAGFLRLHSACFDRLIAHLGAYCEAWAYMESPSASTKYGALRRSYLVSECLTNLHYDVDVVVHDHIQRCVRQHPTGYGLPPLTRGLHDRLGPRSAHDQDGVNVGLRDPRFLVLGATALAERFESEPSNITGIVRDIVTTSPKRERLTADGAISSRAADNLFDYVYSRLHYFTHESADVFKLFSIAGPVSGSHLMEVKSLEHLSLDALAETPKEEHRLAFKRALTKWLSTDHGSELITRDRLSAPWFAFMARFPGEAWATFDYLSSPVMSSNQPLHPFHQRAVARALIARADLNEVCGGAFQKALEEEIPRVGDRWSYDPPVNGESFKKHATMAELLWLGYSRRDLSELAKVSPWPSGGEMSRWGCFTARSDLNPSINPLADLLSLLGGLDFSERHAVTGAFSAIPASEWCAHLSHVSLVDVVKVFHSVCPKDMGIVSSNYTELMHYLLVILESSGDGFRKDDVMQSLLDGKLLPTKSWLERQTDDVVHCLLTDSVEKASYSPLDLFFIGNYLSRRSPFKPGRVSLASTIHSLEEGAQKGEIGALQPGFSRRTFPIDNLSVPGGKLSECHVLDETVAHMQRFLRLQLSGVGQGGAQATRFVHPVRGTWTNAVGEEKPFSFEFPPAVYEFLMDSWELPYVQRSLTYLMNQSGRGCETPEVFIEVIVDALNRKWAPGVGQMITREFRAEISRGLRLKEIEQELRARRQALRASTRHGEKAQVTFIPSRGLLMELAGFISKSCVSELRDLARAYPDATFVTFAETSDPESPKIVGGAFLFDGVLDTPEKERVLVVRGFNPDESFLTQVDSGSLFEAFADYAEMVAKARGFDAVVLPRASFWHDTATIRADAYFHFEESLKNLPAFALGECAVKSFNRMSISEVVMIRDLRGNPRFTDSRHVS